MSKQSQNVQIAKVPVRKDVEACDLRQIAKAIQLYPPLQLNISDLETRWQCSRSTVERLRKRYQLKPISDLGEHPRFDLIDILEIEGVADPEASWALSSDSERKIFAAPLLSIEDLQRLDPGLFHRSLETFRRQARTGKRGAFKVGHRWLFRPNSFDLERLRLLQSSHPNGN